MQTIKSFAVASVLAVASTTAFAGGIAPAEETPPLILPDDTDGSSAGSLLAGSLGSLGGAAPAIIGAVIVAGVAAAGGS